MSHPITVHQSFSGDFLHKTGWPLVGNEGMKPYMVMMEIYFLIPYKGPARKKHLDLILETSDTPGDRFSEPGHCVSMNLDKSGSRSRRDDMWKYWMGLDLSLGIYTWRIIPIIFSG